MTSPGAIAKGITKCSKARANRTTLIQDSLYSSTRQARLPPAFTDSAKRKGHRAKGRTGVAPI